MSEQVFTNGTVGGPISVYVRDGKVVAENSERGLLLAGLPLSVREHRLR